MTARIRAALALACALCALAPTPHAAAGIVSIRIDRTEPVAGGESLGAAGSYVRVVGVARGELDPLDPRNIGIVGITWAPRNAAGRVEYETDFYILRPADAAKANGRLLYEVTNRGRKFLLPWLLDGVPVAAGATNEPSKVEEFGNRFLVDQGTTIVWSGWDPDVPTANGGMSIRVPVATENGQRIVRTIRDEFVFGTRVPTASATAPLSYPAASPDQAAARLTVRARESEAAQEIPAGDWAYAGERAIKLLPDGTKFKPGYIYDFRYPATDPKVLGIGYAATRDLVSFLRYDTAPSGTINPATGNPVGSGSAFRHVLALGISQSGRYLRDHVGQGFNQDESARKVFDGVLAHISGVGRVFANAQFGQPNRTNTQHEDHLFPENAFPFAHGKMADPFTGVVAGLLPGERFDPLIIETNTSTEYWQKGASLLHTDPLGKTDVNIPSGVRLYLIAGTQHGGRANLDASPGTCINPRNPHSPAPALRALLVALDAWVADGQAPPPSRVPTIEAGTLVPPESTGFPKLPGVAIATAGNRISLFGDWTDPRPDPAKSYVSLVAKVDADGNEVAGVRLPAIAVPIATYTGWNLYKTPYPEGELCDRDGTYVPLARTKAEREAAGDPRLSLAERYGGPAGYVAAVTAAADELVKARLLLPADAARYVAEASAKNPLN